MGTALSLLIFAFGAILTFAVRSEPSGLSLTTVGVILMIVAAIGFVTSVYGDKWRRKIVEESIETGTPAPVPVDDTVLVDPSAPIEAPYRPEADLAHPPAHPVHPVHGQTVVNVNEGRPATPA